MAGKKGNQKAKKYTDEDILKKKIDDYFKNCDKKSYFIREKRLYKNYRKKIKK